MKVRIVLVAGAFLIFSSWAAWSVFARRAAPELLVKLQSAPPQQPVPPNLDAHEKQVREQAAELRQLSEAQNMPQRISRETAASVALIIGDYIWTDPTGRRPLRYKGLDKNGVYLRDQDGRESVAFEADGPIVVREFQGTGFLIDSEHVLTGGFVLAPWAADPLLDESENPELIPSIRTLHAYLPGVTKALNLKIGRAAESADAVVCVVDGGVVSGHGLVLSRSEKEQAGEPILLLGYPGGIEILASRVPDDVHYELYKFGRPSMDETAQLLAAKGYIHPIAMPSRVSGQTEDRIFFETLDSTGTTGGPIMNSRGQVIAISQSTHTAYPSFNMAVSVAPMKSWIAKARSAAR